MAVYKSSNLEPSLTEIDLTQDNTFSCQINTSGESIKAYKYSILLNNTEDEIYSSQGTDLPKPIKNKGTLNINNVSNKLSNKLVNGKDYLWGIRTYDVKIGSTVQPSTKVCSGFLVGSTKYVIWTGNNEKLHYDRYIEFETTKEAMMPIIEPNSNNLVLPEGTFRERIKIDWVEKELGWYKNITKIECVDNFTYNYKNGTSFKIFLCSDEHTYTSVYADPNDEIQNSYYIVIYENSEDAKKAHDAKDYPDHYTAATPRETSRRIIGYSSDTGEIRVQEPFKKIPVNGNAYLIYEYDRVEKVYTEITSDVSQVVGGAGIEDESFKVMTNLWEENTKQLFIQPNINIKSDETNPDEIVFDNAGERVDIIKTLNNTLVPNKQTDVTFEKLDNTQWLLRYVRSVDSTITPPIIPGSTYTVYTDFMDSMPYSLFYARTSPTINMQYKNLNTDIDSMNFINITNEVSKPWRDIEFKTEWTSPERVQVKYYQYILYDKNNTEIARSEEQYDSELAWSFRGFQTSDNEIAPEKYKIKINIIDEYDKTFTQEANFLIYYKTEKGVVPMQVTLDCEEQALKVVVTAPVYVESTDKDGKQTVDESNLNPDFDYLEIPKDKVLNYTNVLNITKDKIIIPKTFSALAEFQITSDFVDMIPDGEELTVMEVAHKINENIFDYFTLKMTSFSRYYMDSTGTIVVNNDQFKLKLYKNGSAEPLYAFNNGKQNYFDLNAEFPEFIIPSALSYSLRNANEFNIVDTFPLRPKVGEKYVLTQDINYNQKNYYKGIYTYAAGKWTANTDDEFLFVENLDQIPGYTYDDLSVPENARNTTDNKSLNFAEEGNVWVDVGEYSARHNKDLINTKWFMYYLTVDNTTEEEKVNAILEIMVERE